jgi:uncharacterized protein YggT (Ycf19 family)
VSVFVVATARESIADFLQALLTVYVILIIAYILTSLIFSFGGRIPYSRWSSAILGFLRDVCEPFLRLFRRLLPQFGGFDFSPILALITLSIINNIVVERIIHG